MPDRPSIPREIARAVLVEAGHRCAVCGAPCPLEQAHIVPWCDRKSHERENLVCLCSNCHERSHREKWGEKALKEYKDRPWVLRQNNGHPAILETKRIEIVIDAEFADFDEHLENVFRHALAGFLRISPKAVRIRAKDEGSVRLTMDLPEPEARELLELFKKGSSELAAALPLFKITAIREAPARNLAVLSSQSALAAGGALVVAVGEGPATRTLSVGDLLSLPALQSRVKGVFSRYRIPAHDATDLVQETLLLAEYRREEIRDLEAWFLVTLRNRCVIYWRRRRSALFTAVDEAILALLAEPAGEDEGDFARDLRHVFEELPPRCQKLLRLRYGLGYDAVEVGEGVKNTAPASRKVARRCMAALTYLLIERWKPTPSAGDDDDAS